MILKKIVLLYKYGKRDNMRNSMTKNKSFLKRLRKAKPPKVLQKQNLSDLERRISMHVGNFLVLIEEGSQTQIEQAKQKAQSELLKIGPDMEKVAQEIGGKFPVFVRDYLDSVDSILHSASGFVDDAKITRCFNTTQKLEKAVQSKAA